MQKNRGLITHLEFYAEQQMILLAFSNGIKDNLTEKIKEDIEEKHLLKIESELQ
jgi:RNA-binding protein YhbY